jgi:hypothetical protein
MASAAWLDPWAVVLFDGIVVWAARATIGPY